MPIPDERAYQSLVRDPAARSEHYADVIRAHYRLTTDQWRHGWSDSFHIHVPWFTGNQTLAEALLAKEERLVAEGGFAPGMRLLDVGCGIGGPTATIAARSGAHVTGLNLSAEQVEAARAAHTSTEVAGLLDFVVGDAMHMPFPDHHFDGAFSVEAYGHMPDKVAAFAEAARVLKPGAAFAGYDWLTADGLAPAEYERWIEPLCRDFALSHMIPFGRLAPTLQAAGFVVDRVSRYQDEGDMALTWRLLGLSLRTFPDTPGGEITRSALRNLVEAGRREMCVGACWTAHKADPSG